MGGEAGSRQDAGGTERPTLAPSGPPRRARAKCARMGHPLSETFEPFVLQAFCGTAVGKRIPAERAGLRKKN